MILFNLVLWKAKASYTVKKGGEKVNHSMVMGDLKVFAENKDQIDSLVNTGRSFSDYIKMEFELPSCRVLIMKRGKVAKSEGMSMPDRKAIKNVKEGGYKYLGILESDGVKHEEMKGQIKKEHIRRVGNILKSKLNAGNIISATNSRAVSTVSYGAGILSWRTMQHEELNRKTRQLMAIYEPQHPTTDVDRTHLQIF